MPKNENSGAPASIKFLRDQWSGACQHFYKVKIKLFDTAKKEAQHQMDPLGLWQLSMLYLLTDAQIHLSECCQCGGAAQQGQAVV